MCSSAAIRGLTTPPGSPGLPSLSAPGLGFICSFIWPPDQVIALILVSVDFLICPSGFVVISILLLLLVLRVFLYSSSRSRDATCIAHRTRECLWSVFGRPAELVDRPIVRGVADMSVRDLREIRVTQILGRFFINAAYA